MAFGVLGGKGFTFLENTAKGVHSFHVWSVLKSSTSIQILTIWLTGAGKGVISQARNWRQFHLEETRSLS